MPFVCGFVCGPTRHKKLPMKKKEKVVAMDFRRADPNYVNFVPKTCMDAIDLFNRHRTLGLTADLYPECFVHCARALPDAELDKFHRFIVQPAGDIGGGGEQPTQVDAEIEKERLSLLQEATLRDLKKLAITEEEPEEPVDMSQDEEKSSDDEKMADEYVKITTS